MNNGRLNTWRERGSMALLVGRESLRSFSLNNSFQAAATLAYYGFFSLIPLLLLVVILLSHLALSSDIIFQAVEDVIAELLPNSGALIFDEIHMLTNQKIWGVFSVIILLWAITPLATAIRVAFIQVFKAERNQPFWKTKLFNLAAVVALLALFVSLVVGKMVSLTLAGSRLAGWAPGLLPWLQGGAAFALSTTFIAFFYVVFGPVHLRWNELLIGSAIAMLLLFVIRPVFALILQFNPNYGYAFGSLKAIFIVTVWVYYAFLAILFGAEVMANTRRKESLLIRGLFLRPGAATKWPALLNRYIRRFDPGETLFREGDAGAEMFYVLSGSVAVQKNETTVREMKAGDFFGEMAMLLHEPRTATAVVSEPDTRLVPISQANFDTILRENPAVVQSLLTELAVRLKATTQRLG